MKPSVVMQSDFGLDSGFVACMHGVCKTIDSELNTYDITHLIPAFNIEVASSTLQYVVPCWPQGTVFVSVVDPTVGTSRRASVAKLKNGSYVVTPDNGTLTYLNHMIGIEAIREIDEDVNRLDTTRDVSIFHGRDLFAYCAGKLASGIISFEEVGKEYPVSEIVLHEFYGYSIDNNSVTATVVGSDPFGSIETSIPNKEFSKINVQLGDTVHIVISNKDEIVFDKEVIFHKSFGYVAINEDVVFNDLASFITVATNQASFVKKYKLDPSILYTITMTKK